MTKSHAPSFIASTAVSTVPKAVIRMNSVSGLTVFAARRRSRPFIDGIMRSVRTTLTRVLRSTARASFPSVAVSTSTRSRRKIRARDSRFDGSSSTTNKV